MALLKVKDTVGLHRDTSSGAIINSSVDDYNKYKQQRDKLLAQKNRVDKLEEDVADMKSMLKQILDKI
jgi:small-conductance mechanosensitive channel